MSATYVFFWGMLLGNVSHRGYCEFYHKSMIRLPVLPVGIMRKRGGFQRAAPTKRPRSQHTRPCSPDEATRNPGEVTLGGAPKEVTLGGNRGRSTAVAFLNTRPGLRPAACIRATNPDARLCSPDGATRALQEVPLGGNPGRSTAIIFLNAHPGFPACGLHPGYEPRACPLTDRAVQAESASSRRPQSASPIRQGVHHQRYSL
jgi:hypothetical protein